MSRLNENYEKKGLRGFVAWVNGDGPETLFSEEKSTAANAEAPREKKRSKIGEEIKTSRQLMSSLKSHTGEWVNENAVHIHRRLYRFFSYVVCLSVAAVLLLLVSQLPEIGSPDIPTNNEVPARYIEKATEETGVINSVAGLILNYRGYDTLNESHVLFIATCAVMILLRLDHQKGVVLDKNYEKDENDRDFEPNDDKILQYSVKILTPIVLLFGLTVMFNGHLSPGGGFSGGAIAGGGLVLFLSAFGFKKIERFFGDRVSNIIRVGALSVYTVLMTYFIYMGANQLENGIDLGTPGAIFSAGIILPINICVGLVVACTVYGLFCLFRKGGL